MAEGATCAQSDDFSYTARMHLVEGEDLLLKDDLSVICLSVSLSLTNTGTHKHMYVHICMFVCMCV